MTSNDNVNCIYTTIIGNYDNLPLISVKQESHWDYICFTDNKELKSDQWEIIYVDSESSTKLENCKLSRYYKTNFHNLLSEYNVILYIDARLKIVGDINQYLKSLSNFDIVLMKHPTSSSIKEEMDTLLELKLERESMIDIIKRRYNDVGYNYDNGLCAGGVLLFRNNEKTIKFFNEWWYEIKHFSHRDQLSLNYILSRNPDLNVRFVKFREIVSTYFRQMPRKSKRLKF